ncbi:hypothetical protein Vadar_000697 [Vaccinium darrowii]|uniref:Uncharacterized protein n=1 Tax=Vaccinium darrowii TaxID=229202 RepID=A0ACB7XWI7_9ERIC|nr:hypothetical protein Vadar_000697 [Vaccinium darrowii]
MFYDKIEEFHEFCQANNSTVQAISRGNEASDQRWIPPDGNVLKINVDRAYDPCTYKGGVGLVICDDQGNVRRAIAIPIQNTHSAKMVEALGFRMAVCMAKECADLGYIVEGDARGVINMLQEKNVPKVNLEVINRDSIVFYSSLNSVSFT